MQNKFDVLLTHEKFANFEQRIIRSYNDTNKKINK